MDGTSQLSQYNSINYKTQYQNIWIRKNNLVFEYSTNTPQNLNEHFLTS